MKKNNNRNVNIDLIKCIAVFSVVSIHFFLNTGFYLKTVDNSHMIMLGVLRTLFTICVPLFLIVTGYLMKNKELNKAYYFGVIKTLFIYIIITTMILLYNRFYLGSSIGIKQYIKHLLEFDVGYCWYIEMYIGLFILIPFLNILYNNISSKHNKLILILSMMFLTTIPAFIDPIIVIFPNWWVHIYPITYYFVGCYLREYRVNISYFKLILSFLILFALGSTVIIVQSYGNKFINGDNWNNLFTFGMSIVMFILIINLNLEKANRFIKKIIIKTSELSLGIYLSSYIADCIIYDEVFKGYLLGIKYYFMLVPLVFVISLIISFVANTIYKIIDKLIVDKLKTKLLENKK